MFLALGWFTLARVYAQGPTQIQGQLINGTKDAALPPVLRTVPVTLFQITAAGPVTPTLPTDADG